MDSLRWFKTKNWVDNDSKPKSKAIEVSVLTLEKKES